MTTTGPQDRKDASQELAGRLGVKKASGGAVEQKNPLDELEATIAKLENADARELLQQKAKNLRAKMELEEKQTRAQIRRIEEGRDQGESNNNVDEREVTRINIAATAMQLLEKGMDPKVVGQYLIGSQAGAIPIGLGGGGQQGLTMADVTSIFTLAKGEKGTAPELTAILNKLTDKVNELDGKIAAVAHQEPKMAWVIHPDGTKEQVQPGEPVVIKSLPSDTGKNVEMVREENRHAEEVEKIKTERDYKQGLTQTIASLPEKIGAGLAASFVDAEQPPGKSAARTAPTDKAILHLKCETEGCGYEIPYAPNATEVTCPKCKEVYKRTPDK